MSNFFGGGIALAETESDSSVLEVLAFALNHLDVSDRSIRLKSAIQNKRGETRMAAAFSLGGLNDDVAIQSLLCLSKDSDENVRNWATFGLGTQTDLDTPEIRQALFDRLEDEHEETKHEAILGLSKRHDERVLRALIQALSSGDVWCVAVEAANEMANPLLYPLLIALRVDDDKSDKQLEEAIESCRPKDC